LPFASVESSEVVNHKAFATAAFATQQPATLRKYFEHLKQWPCSFGAWHCA